MATDLNMIHKNESFLIFCEAVGSSSKQAHGQTGAGETAVILECDFTVMASRFDISAKDRPPEYLNTIPSKYFYIKKRHIQAYHVEARKCREIPKFRNVTTPEFQNIEIFESRKIMFESEYCQSRNDVIN
uniref:Uncharacterized protein n=1 Tax=Glossina pallidipes TaxID=7398 RepID=A0A1A9ZZ73_GLOPL